MDAGKRNETPGSKTKKFITHGTASSMGMNVFVSISLSISPSLMRIKQRTKMDVSSHDYNIK